MDFFDETRWFPSDVQGPCMDACVKKGLGGPRLRYPSMGVSWWSGTNCTKFASDIVDRCSNKCSVGASLGLH